MMKKKIISVAAVIFVTAAILFAVLWLPNGNEGTHTQSEDITSKLVGEEGVETSAEISREEVYGERLTKCVKLIESGVYKLTVTRNSRIGGLSVPVTTVSYHGDGFISIVEYEGHDIKTEVFVNADGAYYLSTDINTAYLLPADTVDAEGLAYKGLKYIESGSTDTGTSAYEYERYLLPNGQTADYLFAGESLEKIKLYTDGVYELISISLSDDISGARQELPEGLTIIDNR